MKPTQTVPIGGTRVAVGDRTLAAREVAPAEPESSSQLGIAERRPVSVAVAAPVEPRPPKSSAPPAPPAPATAPVEQPPAAEPVSAPPSTPPSVPHLVANFENGLDGWSPALTSDVTPRIATGVVRDGSKASVVRLTGDQASSQLILGGDGGTSGDDAIQLREGDEYAFAFSFYVQRMVYGEPGADNMVLRFKGDASEGESFALQLWDYAGVPWQTPGGGLWASGSAVGDDRFLTAISERAWHDVIVHFKASGQGAGFYAVYLDEQLVDARSEVSTIAAGSEYAQIEVGLFRDAERVKGTSEIRIDAARFGPTLESVLPQ